MDGWTNKPKDIFSCTFCVKCINYTLFDTILLLFQTKETSFIKEEPSFNEITSRSDRFKVKKRIVIGNVSKLVLETSV